MSTNRRDVLTASLVSAAAIGLSAKDAASTKADSPAERDSADTSPAPVSLYDYEVAAKRILSGSAWEYFNGGSADEITLRRNRQALDLLQLKPKVLIDVTSIDWTCPVSVDSFSSFLIDSLSSCLLLDLTP